MGSSSRITVIGGGVMGASVAFHLAERGCRGVTVLERRSLASGPTGYSSALLRQHYSIEIYARLAHKSLQFYREFRERVGGDCGFVHCGLAVVVGPEDLNAIRQVVAMQRTIGIETDLVTPGALGRLFGSIQTDDVAAGAFESSSGFADPVATTVSLMRRARDLGVHVLEDKGVLEILTAGGRISGIRTAEGTLGADVVVVTAGPWSRDLVRPLGVDLPVRASRHQLGLLGVPGPPRSRPILIDMVQGCYFRPEVDNQLFVGVRNPAGVVSEADPDNFKTGLDQDAAERAACLAAHRFPEMERAELRGGYAAIYDMTPDLHFIIDQPRSVDGLFVAAGFSGHGFKHAPMIGRLLAEWLLDGKPKTADLSPFSLDRFRTGNVLKGCYTRWPY